MDETLLKTLIAQEQPPVPLDAPTFGKVVTVPGALGLVGLIIFAGFFQLSLQKKTSLPFRHIGTLLIVAGLVVSFRTFSELTDKDTGALYRAAIVSQYTLIAHYALPALLLLLLAAIGSAEVYLNKNLPSRSA